MKPIFEFLLSKKNKKQNPEAGFTIKAWDDDRFCRNYIKSDQISPFILRALEQSNTTPAQIEEEFGYYKDPDDLWNAYERGDLSAYIDFEEAMVEILSNEYCEKEDAEKIMGNFFDVCFDVMIEVENHIKNNETNN